MRGGVRNSLTTLIGNLLPGESISVVERKRNQIPPTTRPTLGQPRRTLLTPSSIGCDQTTKMQFTSFIEFLVQTGTHWLIGLFSLIDH